MPKMKNSMREEKKKRGGQLQQQQQAACEHRLPKQRKKRKEKKKQKVRNKVDVNDRNGQNKKAITGKHLGPLCLWTACGLLVDTIGGWGQWSEVEKKRRWGGATESKKKRYRDRKGVREKERAAQLPLQSK